MDVAIPSDCNIKEEGTREVSRPERGAKEVSVVIGALGAVTSKMAPANPGNSLQDLCPDQFILYTTDPHLPSAQTVLVCACWSKGFTARPDKNWAFWLQ